MRTLVVPAAVMFLAVAPVFAQPTREHLDAMRRLRLGQDSLRLERFDAAEAEFQAAILLEPSLEMAHYGLGQVYMATRRYPAAVHAYLACRDAFVFSNRQRALGDLEAQRALDDQIKAVQEQESALASGTGNVLSGGKFELDRRISDLRALQRQSKSTSGIPAWISVALGSAYFRSDAIADAEREFLAALQADPKLGEAHNNLAVVYLQTGRYDKAEEEISAAEKNGFRVNPQLKADVRKAQGRS
jgi:tetratricopeptide (TPR) repeat protein